MEMEIEAVATTIAPVVLTGAIVAARSLDFKLKELKNRPDSRCHGCLLGLAVSNVYSFGVRAYIDHKPGLLSCFSRQLNLLILIISNFINYK